MRPFLCKKADMDESREQPQAGIDEPGSISAGGTSTKCRVINLSAEGAAIEVANASHVPRRFRLTTEKDRVVWNCRIVWINQNRIGVLFEER